MVAAMPLQRGPGGTELPELDALLLIMLLILEPVLLTTLLTLEPVLLTLLALKPVLLITLLTEEDAVP